MLLYGHKPDFATPRQTGEPAVGPVAAPFLVVVKIKDFSNSHAKRLNQYNIADVLTCRKKKSVVKPFGLPNPKVFLKG